MTTKCMKSKEKEMPDQEKVIKGLQIERECVSRDCDRDCGKCDLVQDKDWLLSVYDDTLALLKEQEPVNLIADFDKTDGTWYCCCGNCYKRIDNNDKYCRHCGRKVKWND